MTSERTGCMNNSFFFFFKIEENKQSVFVWLTQHLFASKLRLIARMILRPCKNTKYLLHTCIILLETNIWEVEQEAKIIH